MAAFGAKKTPAAETTGKRKAAGDKSKKSKPADQNDWQTVEAADYAVLVRATTKGGKKQTKAVRRSLERDGTYVSLKKQKTKSAAVIATPIMRVVSVSTLSGEGDVGTGKDYDIHRGNCHFNIGLACGQVDGVTLKDGLLEEQVAWVKKVYAIGCYLLEQTFESGEEMWKRPVERAYTDARRELCSEFGARKPMQMIDIEEENEEARDKVKKRACELFIEGAKNIPGAPKADNNGEFDDNDMPVVWATAKVWAWEDFDPARDSQSTESGPALDKLPSNKANWGRILDQMTGPMRRKYKYLEYQDGSTMIDVPRPTIRIVRTTRDINTGAEVKHEKVVGDPFWNPVLESTKGKPLDTMVKTSLIFAVYRGPLQSDNTYGVKFYLGSKIAIAARRVRKTQMVPMANEGPVEGMTTIDEDDEEQEEQVLEETPAEEGEIGSTDEVVGEDTAEHDAEKQPAKRSRKLDDDEGVEDDDEVDDDEVDDEEIDVSE